MEPCEWLLLCSLCEIKGNVPEFFVAKIVIMLFFMEAQIAR